MPPLRVVIALPDPPLPFGDASARWYYVLVRGLVERGHRVTVYSAFDEAADPEEAEALFPSSRFDVHFFARDRRRGVRTKWRTVSRPHSYLFGEELRRALAGRLRQGFDILHLEGLWTGWLGVDHPDRAVLHVHYLFEIDLAQAPVSSLTERLLRAVRLRATERLLRSYRHMTTLTPRLTQRVREIAPRAEVATVPLGMDLSRYPYGDRAPALDRPVVSLIGSFTWYPTYAAGVRLLTRMWPEIKRRVPNAVLQVVGRRARAALGRLADLPDVVIHENVPDILPYFTQGDVLVYAPPDASGMKVKVLEAFAMGLPVVTTPAGVEGIPAIDGVHAGIAEDDAALVERVVALLTSPSQWREVRSNARTLVEAHCNPDGALDRLEEFYRRIVATDARAGIRRR